MINRRPEGRPGDKNAAECRSHDKKHHVPCCQRALYSWRDICGSGDDDDDDDVDVDTAVVSVSLSWCLDSSCRETSACS